MLTNNNALRDFLTEVENNRVSLHTKLLDANARIAELENVAEERGKRLEAVQFELDELKDKYKESLNIHDTAR